MQSNANNIVKALIVALGLSIGGTAKAATLNDHLKIDPSANTIHVVNVSHVDDGTDVHKQATLDHGSVANRVVGDRSVHLAPAVQAVDRILEHEKVDAIGVNRLPANTEQDLHTKMLNGVEAEVPDVAQSPCPVDPVGNLQLRC
jgi:hypothetical protein